MNKIFAIVKDNYVINRVVVSEEDAGTYVYPLPHDFMQEDAERTIHVGDWYEAAEGIFYRPMGIPPDWPTELDHLKPQD